MAEDGGRGTQGLMETGATVEFRVHFRNGRRGRRRLRQGARPKSSVVEPGHVPRISRLMALAIHFDRLIRQGTVRDYADLARLGGVTRARISQIMDLLNLAPEIQERILLLPRVPSGRDPLTERQFRQAAAVPDWEEQWRVLRREGGAAQSDLSHTHWVH